MGSIDINDGIYAVFIHNIRASGDSFSVFTVLITQDYHMFSAV